MRKKIRPFSIWIVVIVAEPRLTHGKEKRSGETGEIGEAPPAEIGSPMLPGVCYAVIVNSGV